MSDNNEDEGFSSNNNNNDLNIVNQKREFPRNLIRNIKILLLISSVTSKKLPNVYKSCPKMISVEK